jgi:hypothetical protein
MEIKRIVVQGILTTWEAEMEIKRIVVQGQPR